MISKNIRNWLIGGIIAIAVGGFFTILTGIQNDENTDEIIKTIEEENKSPISVSTDETSNPIQYDKIDSKTGFLTNNFKPNNPKIIFNEEVGFQVTIPDPEDYELSSTSTLSWFAFKNYKVNESLNDPLSQWLWGWQKKIQTIEPKNPDFIEYTIEMYHLEPNHVTREVNIQNIVKMLSGLNINNIQSEIESSVDGIWFEEECKKWDNYNCKKIGWINFIQQNDEMLMTLVVVSLDRDDFFSEFHEEIKFILDSIQPLY